MFLKSTLAVAVLAVLASATGSNAETLRVHLDADIRSTDPGVNRDGNTDGVVLHMVEGLVGYDEKGQVRPLLAEKIDVSQDGRTYVFTLRKGVLFHNGATLTANDVVWSWNRYMTPKTGWRCIADFDGRTGLKVEKVEATGPDTVSFTLDRSYPLFLQSLARSDCGMTAITHRDSVKADGSWDKPIGTGPYQLAEWKPRQYTSLKKFDGYVGRTGQPDGYIGSKPALVDEIRFVVISDPATAKAALLSGDIDIITKLPLPDVEELKKNPDIVIDSKEQLAPQTLPLQTRDPILSNVKIRQAIAASIDYQQLAEGVTYGLAKANNSIVPSASPFYGEAESKLFKYDPELSKKLLAEAGYKGEKITLFTNMRNQMNYDSSVIAQAMMQQAGLNAVIEVVEWGTQQDRYQSGNYQMMSYTYSSRMDPSLSFEAIIGSKDVQSRKVWDDADAQKKLTASMNETDAAKRQKIFDELHQQMLEQVPIIPLFNYPYVGAVRKNVTGYATSAIGLPILWGVSKK